MKCNYCNNILNYTIRNSLTYEDEHTTISYENNQLIWYHLTECIDNQIFDILSVKDSLTQIHLNDIPLIEINQFIPLCFKNNSPISPIKNLLKLKAFI